MRIQFQYKHLSEVQKTRKFRLFYQEYLNSNTRVNIKGNYTLNPEHLNSSMQTNLYQTSRNKKHKINISYCTFHATNSSIFWQGPLLWKLQFQIFIWKRNCNDAIFPKKNLQNHSWYSNELHALCR